MNQLASVLLSGGSIIDLDGTIFVQLGLFATAYVLLYFVLFRPMVRLFEAREVAIDGAREEADHLQKEAKKAAASFDLEMAQVRAQASAERERLQKEGQKLERGLLESVRAETEKKLSEAGAKLTEEATRLRSELRTDVPKLATQIASKLLEREVR